MNTMLPDLFRCLITNIMIAVLIYIMSMVLVVFIKIIVLFFRFVNSKYQFM
jgi:hypothetical protein